MDQERNKSKKLNTSFLGKRLRFAMLISSEELAAAPQHMKRDLSAELMTVEGYIGTADIEDAVMYIFDGHANINAVVNRVKRIGFASAGPVEEPVFIKDSQIHYPEYRKYRNYRYSHIR